MTELYIDGTRASIDPALSIDTYDYNTSLDKDNEREAYTYDIDLELRDSANAALYRHIDRINVQHAPTGRKAKLYVDGRLLIEGSEIILQTDGQMVKIQIVSSETTTDLRTVEQRIRELDLGRVDAFPLSEDKPYWCSGHEAEIQATVAAAPLTVPAVYTPVLTDTGDMDGESFDPYNLGRSSTRKVTVNHYKPATTLDSGTPTPGDNEESIYGQSPNVYPWCPQPYLIVVIERVLSALGLTVADNVLRRMPFARRLIMVQAVEPRYLARMLPDWTVGEFIKEVEHFFNVRIVSDNITHTVRILPANGSAGRNATPYVFEASEIVNVEGCPSRELGNEESYFTSYKNVLYDLPDNQFTHRASLDKSIMEKVSYINYDEGEFSYPSWAGRSAHNENGEQTGFFKYPFILHDNGTDTDWMVTDDCYTTAQLGDHDQTVHAIARCNHLAPYHDENATEGEELTLRIVPADIRPMYCDRLTVPVPVASIVGKPIEGKIAAAGEFPGVEEGTFLEAGFTDWVTAGKYDDSDRIPTRIEVVQFLGNVPPPKAVYYGDFAPYQYPDDVTLATLRYPQCINTRYIESAVWNILAYNGRMAYLYHNIILDSLWYQDAPSDEELTFDLSKRVVEDLSFPYDVDITEVHAIALLHHGRRLDTERQFIIGGRRYVCISLNYKVQNCHLLPYVIGKFLPMK